MKCYVNFDINMDEELFKKKYKLIRLLANPLRLKMAYIMTKREVCNCELKELFNTDPTLISHHLKRFKNEGVLIEKREGKWIKYRIVDETITKIINILFENEKR